VEFTLRRRDRKGLLGKEDREEIITSLRYKTHWPNTHPLIQGLRRGVRGDWPLTRVTDCVPPR
jgi:hypothetical protein